MAGLSVSLGDRDDDKLKLMSPGLAARYLELKNVTAMRHEEVFPWSMRVLYSHICVANRA